MHDYKQDGKYDLNYLLECNKFSWVVILKHLLEFDWIKFSIY